MTIFLQILFKILAIKYNKGIIKPMENPLHYFSFYLCLLQVKIGGYSIVFKPNDTQIRGLKPLFFSWWLVGKKNHANLHKDPPPSICGVIKGAFILSAIYTQYLHIRNSATTHQRFLFLNLLGFTTQLDIHYNNGAFTCNSITLA